MRTQNKQDNKAGERTQKWQAALDQCDGLIDIVIDSECDQEDAIYTATETRSQALEMLRSLRR